MIFKSSNTLIYTALILQISLSSCSTLSYYSQSVLGHVKVVRASESIDKLLNSANTNEEVKIKLRKVLMIRDFASSALKLPENDSYRVYADIGRKFVVWNVIATPALSLEPHQSCFLLVGCLSYKGFYKKSDALTYLRDLKDRGFDVFLGGVTAYSTLGWFDDPVLNGMLMRSETALAKLIFHELSHQKLYIKDDTEFNEAFADAVAHIGTNLWLDTYSDDKDKKEYRQEMERENQFTDLVLDYRLDLQQLYQSDLSNEEKLIRKNKTLGAMVLDYEAMRTAWGDYTEYDNWFYEDLNNAKLAALATYRSLVPQFLQLFNYMDGDFDSFYNFLTGLSKCTPEQRRIFLAEPSSRLTC